MIKVFRITFILLYSVKLKHTSYQTNQLSRLYSSSKNFCCSTRGASRRKNKHEKIKFPTIVPSLPFSFSVRKWRGQRGIEEKNNFSNNENYVDPNWISGFLDGEGCFHVSIYKKSLNKKYYVKPQISIGIHRKDLSILELIINNLGVGKINYKHGLNSVQLKVNSLDEIETVIAHLDKFPLRTKKCADFLLFKEVIHLIKMKEHLTIKGVNKVVALKASMNRNLSEKLIKEFSPVDLVDRPMVKTPDNFNPFWLAGFTAAEGSFYIIIQESQTNSTGFKVILTFQLTQHSRDEQLLISLIKYLGCGAVSSDREFFRFRVTKLYDITNKIIPFFKKYPILGVKAKDFKDWCLVADMMNKKKHLTEEGLEEIQKIKETMNKKKD